MAVIPFVSALGFLGGQLPAARQLGFGRIFQEQVIPPGETRPGGMC